MQNRQQATQEDIQAFKEIQRAYDVLSDPLSRRQYDAEGTTLNTGNQSAGVVNTGGSCVATFTIQIQVNTQNGVQSVPAEIRIEIGKPTNHYR